MQWDQCGGRFHIQSEIRNQQSAILGVATKMHKSTVLILQLLRLFAAISNF
jgi:hypothetical protein